MNNTELFDELTCDLNIAEGFLSSLKEQDDFGRLNYMKLNLEQPGLSLSKDAYIQLQSKYNFTFLVINKENK